MDRDGERRSWAGLATERIHPHAARLDRLSPARILALMAREDRRVVTAVQHEAPAIERAAAKCARALDEGGRLFYVGAGTSGRLGVLEAAECPPTFGTEPGQIAAILAGGDEAVFLSREGAEDDTAAARRALRGRRLRSRDLVVGISASSVTPFVRAALEFARERSAETILVTCGKPGRGLARLVVAPQVGPELVAGSTRLKAATATKLVLNQMTLLAMVSLGKIYGPYMVDVKPTSAKLRDRARRMVASLGGVSVSRAGKLLAAADDEVKTAILVARLRLSVEESRRMLAERKGRLRELLPESSRR